MNRIEDIEKKHLETILAGKKITEFYPGDTVKVNVRIVEGKRQRVQAFEGVCICLLYTSPSPRDLSTSRMPSSA